MKRLKSSIAAWSAVGALTSFVILNELLTHDQMIEFSYSLVLGVTFAGLLRWTREAGLGLLAGRTGPDFLIVGVWAVFLVVFFQRCWAVAVRVLDRPQWMLDSPVQSFIPWMMAWAFTLVLIAPDTMDGNLPNVSKYLMAIALFIAGLVTGVSLTIAVIQNGSI